MKQAPSFQPLLTPEFVISALHLTQALPARGHSAFTEVCTDSRKIKPGCLFVALSGERFDGHEFVAQAFERGAAAAICRKGFELGKPGALIFRVDDTLEAFRMVAAKWRREFSIPVVVVAGSNGKTTTKELLSACLRGKFASVLKTTGSQNGFVGIPMTLLELTPAHGAAVIEVGIDELGAMEKHMTVVGGTGAILTSISHEHLEKLRDLATIAREEGVALSTTARAGGLCVVNLDDPWIRPHWATLKGGRKTGYRLGAHAPARVASGEEVLIGTIKGAELAVRGQNFPEAAFALPLPGEHNAANLLGAIAVAASLGLTAAEIRKGLQSFQGAGGRSELKRLAGGLQVLCDYYNANPSSMRAAIAVVNQLGGAKERWLCLADMLGLGPEEETFHRELAKSITDSRAEHVLLLGERMRALEDELRKLGFRADLRHFESREELGAALVAGVQPGDCVLIKGSHSMQMEKVWELLQAGWSG